MSGIPRFFHSLEFDEPFQKCLTCEGQLNEISNPYTITKVFRGPECVFEYAMCIPCRIKMAEKLSEDSRQHMKDFFDKNEHIHTRAERLADRENFAEWLEECATCRMPISKLEDYSTACMAFGDELIFDHFPLSVCSKCECEMQSKLSKSSREEWDRFVGANFEGPPADSIKPDGIPMLV